MAGQGLMLTEAVRGGGGLTCPAAGEQEVEGAERQNALGPDSHGLPPQAYLQAHPREQYVASRAQR